MEESHYFDDSFLSQIQKGKLWRKGSIKAQYFPNEKFDDFYHYAIPLVSKNPDQIVLHIETKSAPYWTPAPEKMFDQNFYLAETYNLWDYYFDDNVNER